MGHRLRALRRKWSGRRRDHDAARAEKAVRRAGAKAQFRNAKTLNEGRNDPGSGGAGGTGV
jgi:hypothetical protein